MIQSPALHRTPEEGRQAVIAAAAALHLDDALETLRRGTETTTVSSVAFAHHIQMRTSEDVDFAKNVIYELEETGRIEITDTYKITRSAAVEE